MRPLAERVVIKLLASEEVTKSGIVLPDTAKEKPQEGEVIAVGPGRLMDNGQRAPMEVKVGDIVLFAKYSGVEIKRDGVDYMILNADRDILAVMN
ncbi:MAG: co-chaperone GroES [Bacillota bacterium]|nr:co-chaperone GroES [Bacillota bacterium]